MKKLTSKLSSLPLEIIETTIYTSVVLAILLLALLALPTPTCADRLPNEVRCCCQTVTGGLCCRLQSYCLNLVPGCQCKIQ